MDRKTLIVILIVTVVGLISSAILFVPSYRDSVGDNSSAGISVIPGDGKVSPLNTVTANNRRNVDENAFDATDRGGFPQAVAKQVVPSSPIDLRNTEALNDRLLNESRDSVWAPQAESTIKSRFTSLSDANIYSPVEVRCKSTMCAASTTVTVDGNGGGQAEDAVLQAMTDRTNSLSGSHSGFQDDTSTQVFVDPKNPGTLMIISYFFKDPAD